MYHILFCIENFKFQNPYSVLKFKDRKDKMVSEVICFLLILKFLQRCRIVVECYL